jgi:hypothetical protein
MLALLLQAAWGEIYLVDDGQKSALKSVEGPKFDAVLVDALPHVSRKAATITLQFEGEDYNHRHLNVRLATLEAHPVNTVLTEYSEALAPDVHRITFGGYTFTQERMLQVYYCGDWYALVLDALEH